MSEGRRERNPGRSRRDGSSTDGSVDLTRLLDIVATFSRKTICVIGDFVLDEFVSGEISRVSREAPVLILRHRRTEAYPGGGANAVNNLAALGARVLPVGVVGKDSHGQELLGYFRHKGVDVSGIVAAADWTTTTKTRYLAGWTHTTEQQVLRVDREPRSHLPAKLQSVIARNTRRFAKRADAVLVSDYGLGAITPDLVRESPRRFLRLIRVTGYATFAVRVLPPPHRMRPNWKPSTRRASGRIRANSSNLASARYRISVCRPSLSRAAKMAWRYSSAAPGTGGQRALCGAAHPDLRFGFACGRDRGGRYRDRSFYACAGGRSFVYRSGASLKLCGRHRCDETPNCDGDARRAGSRLAAGSDGPSR